MAGSWTGGSPIDHVDIPMRAGDGLSLIPNVLGELRGIAGNQAQRRSGLLEQVDDLPPRYRPPGL
ncbi:hypothetical protein [Sphingobium ummariense]